MEDGGDDGRVSKFYHSMVPKFPYAMATVNTTTLTGTPSRGEQQKARRTLGFREAIVGNGERRKRSGTPLARHSSLEVMWTLRACRNLLLFSFS